MPTLEEHLKQNCMERELSFTLNDLTKAFKEIYMALTSVSIHYDSSQNSFGETQLNLDLIADKIMHKHLENSPFVSCFVSEEQQKEICFVGKQDNKYHVAFDPLDGSSVTESGLAVGTVVGIYENVTSLIGASGKNLKAVIYAIYGSHLKIVYATRECGVHIFSVNENDEIVLEKENVKLKDRHNICAFGNLNKAHQIKDLYGLIGYWAENNYSLRYSGSMVADLHNILQKGGGVFAFPGAKLRLLYECAPMSFLFELAGGKATDGKQAITEIKAEDIDTRTPFIIGSKGEVEIAQRFLVDLH